MIEIGDVVRVARAMKRGDGSTYLAAGKVGKVVDSAASGLFDVRLTVEIQPEGFLFNVWSEELELVTKCEPDDGEKAK